MLTVAYGIFWLTVITFGTQWGVTRLEAGRASIIIIMELVAAVVSANLLLGETMAAMELVGGALVVGAVLVETFRELSRAASSRGAFLRPSHTISCTNIERAAPDGRVTRVEP